MIPLATALLAALAATASPPAAEAAPPTIVTACAGRDGWSDAAPPAHVYGNTWYVGTCGISAILITSDQGHVLVDGGTPQAAPLVLANIAALGFRPQDVRLILSSHEHFDHAGALAALKRATGAKVAALATEAEVLETGKPVAADPQYGQLDGFDPVTVDRVLADGDSVTLGKLAVTAHATPAHSPGSTSWTWQACTPDFTCRMIAYADSATAISADGYRFADHPDRVAAVRQGLSTIAALPCDILLTPHPSASATLERLAGETPLVDPSACAAYATAARERFEQRLDAEGGKRR